MVKQKAVADVFKPALGIVDEVIVSINCSNPIEVLNFFRFLYAIAFNCVHNSEDQSSFDFISAVHDSFHIHRSQ